MGRHDIRLAHFAGVITVGLSIPPPRKLQRFRERPGRIFIPILQISFGISLLVRPQDYPLSINPNPSTSLDPLKLDSSAMPTMSCRQGFRNPE
jgi:hypothetical protein